MKEPLFYRIVRPIVTFLMKLVFRPNYIGLENIPKSGRITSWNKIGINSAKAKGINLLIH